MCHTVVVDKDPKTGEIQYQASSPDELALIMGAKQMGLTLKDKTQKSMLIANELTGEQEEYEILREFPFDSTRKRMTLIVRHRGRILLMTKGADSIILPRVSYSQKDAEAGLHIRVQRELLNFAKEGLRTLVVGQKELDQGTLNLIQQQIDDVLISNASQTAKENALNEIYDEYEQGLTYVGSSAIEDKLQYGVPETIAMLISANIKVWVLTGDKQETAIEIGKSCQLIQSDMVLEILTSPNSDELAEKLTSLTQRYPGIHSASIRDIEQFRSHNLPKGVRLSLVIDGPTLAMVFNEPSLT